jgi:lipopolysaccharide biosynthesis regulator YciM
MLDDAAMVLEEIAPEDKTRNEVLGTRVVLYMAAKKWDMAAAVASHLVKVSSKPGLVDQSRVSDQTDRWCRGRRSLRV